MVDRKSHRHVFQCFAARLWQQTCVYSFNQPLSTTNCGIISQNESRHIHTTVHLLITSTPECSFWAYLFETSFVLLFRKLALGTHHWEQRVGWEVVNPRLSDISGKCFRSSHQLHVYVLKPNKASSTVSCTAGKNASTSDVVHMP